MNNEQLQEKQKKIAAFDGWLFAHRGFHCKPDAPENSLAAFERAVERGYGAELDVHLLKDGTLAILHDSTLKRMTGKEGMIEDLTREDLSSIYLGKSKQCIPTLEQVLEVFDRKTPLIVELKPARGNDEELTEKTCQLLDQYHGLYCMESFSPLVVRWLKKHRPDIVRGQLSMDYYRDKKRGGVSVVQAFILTNLLHGMLTSPDFIAYRFKDRNNLFNRLYLKRLGRRGAAWTLRTPEDLAQAQAEGLWPIFENFTPIVH